jgi:hypothetical protein
MSVRELDRTLAARTSAVPFGQWDYAVALVHPTGESVTTVAQGPYRQAFAGGGPRCSACRDGDGRAAEAQHNQAEHARAERGADIDKRVEEATSTDDIVALIAGNSDAITPSVCMAAWRRLARTKAIPPSHDWVTAEARIRRKRLPEGPWPIVGRRDLWCFREGMGWLDADGEGWTPGWKKHRNGNVELAEDWLLKRTRTKTVRRSVVLPKGMPFDVVYEMGAYWAVGGTDVEGWASMADSVGDKDHVRAVAKIVTGRTSS